MIRGSVEYRFKQPGVPLEIVMIGFPRMEHQE